MKLAIVFKNFGPYHHARVRALAAYADVLPIEVTSRSEESRWGAAAAPAVSPVSLGSVATRRAGMQAGDPGARLAAVLNEFQPDGLVVPGWYEAISRAGISWALAARVPVIMMSESTRHDARRYAHREFLKRQIIALCSGAIVGGTQQASYVVELGMAGSAVVDGYDVVDNEHFGRGAAAARADADHRRAALRLPPRFFLASSRFIPRKNLHGLVSAYARYRRSQHAQPWSLVILGYGPGERALVAQIEREGLREEVLVHGFKPYEQLGSYYGLAGAFIHPAVSEPWGLVVNEAMAAGLPVLVSRAAGCAPDLVRDGETGVTFDPADTAQLSDLMARISGDESFRLRLSRGAVRHIADWSPTRFGRNLAELAHRVMGQGYSAPGLVPRMWLQTLRRAS